MFLNDFDLNKRVINVPPATHPLHTTLNISLHACVMAPRSGSADAAPPPWLSAPRAARAHGYNELLHRADWEPASEPSSEQQTHRHRPRATPAPPARSRMPGGKRGLVAPQNTFLENIVRRSSGESARRSEACFGGVRSHRLAARTRTLLEYCVFLCQCDHGGLVEDKHTITLYRVYLCTDGVHHLFQTARGFIRHIKSR